LFAALTSDGCGAGGVGPVKPEARSVIDAAERPAGLRTAMITATAVPPPQPMRLARRNLSYETVIAGCHAHGKGRALAVLAKNQAAVGLVGAGSMMHLRWLAARMWHPPGQWIPMWRSRRGCGAHVRRSARLSPQRHRVSLAHDAPTSATNLVCGFRYNVRLIPVAAGSAGHFSVGRLLSPMLGKRRDGSLIRLVITNALRLRRCGRWSDKANAGKRAIGSGWAR